MKFHLLLSAAVFMAACNSTPSGQTVMAKAPDSVSSQTINSPYPIGYSSKFAIDSPKNAETLLAIWKNWDNNNTAAFKDLFADSIDFYFSDGTIIRTRRDSAIAMAQKVRNSYAASVDR